MLLPFIFKQTDEVILCEILNLDGFDFVRKLFGLKSFMVLVQHYYVLTAFLMTDFEYILNIADSLLHEK